MQKQSAEGLMSLLRIVGKAFSHLTSYESRQAIDTIEWLSARHKRSSWVLSLMAKAYFELADYKQATRLVLFLSCVTVRQEITDYFYFKVVSRSARNGAISH